MAVTTRLSNYPLKIDGIRKEIGIDFCSYEYLDRYTKRLQSHTTIFNRGHRGSLTFASDYRIVPFYLNFFSYMDAIRFEFRSFARDLGREGEKTGD